MKIEVTQDDIERGDHTAWNCPVARACTRKGLTSVLIHPTNYYLEYKSSIHMHYNPLEVTKFIKNFDLDTEVHPFEFDERFQN